ncbi:unnamed protein product [Rotaria sp. Silwood1]|nr:unnamed protein product [Rotaria sp. Silwood1]CAF4696414.1 unnamed protein product [Rotaria sp. Silwood1]
MATASENDATNALEEAQRALQQIDKQSLTEIARYSNPPNTIATLMQAVGIFLQPEISKAQRALEQIDKQSLTEIARYSNPPNAIAILMQLAGIFLQPGIPSNKFSWKEGPQLLKKNNFL